MTTLSKFDVLTSLGAANRTGGDPTTYSGAAVDLRSYVNPGGRQLKAVLNIGSITSTVGRTVGLGTSRQVQFAFRLNF